MNEFLMTAAILLPAAALMTVALRAVDRHIRRRQQLAFLRGPLREQLHYMMSSPMKGRRIMAHDADRLPAATTVTVAPIRPVALLTEQQLSA